MSKKPNLLVVAGSKCNTLEQMLNHYTQDVGDIYVVNYKTTNKLNHISFNKINKIIQKFNAKSFEIEGQIFNFQLITNVYNEIKSLKPNEWWIIADDDELQIYSKSIEEIIDDCESNNWKFVRGGLIDKISESGDFSSIREEDNLWELFPVSSFFSEHISNAEPSKITLLKGDIILTTGQHYVYADKRFMYPIEKNFTQVHHFKWDKSLISSINDRLSLAKYPITKETERLAKYLLNNNYKINLSQFEFTMKSNKNYNDYLHWNNVRDFILKRFDRIANYLTLGKRKSENKNLSNEEYIDIGFDLTKNI